jgi:diguanylate cyclase (GGDEF)-like protein/PAS domain S-box-containing protein
MNPYALPSLFSVVLVLILGDVIYHADKKASLNRIFALNCLVLAVLAFSEFMYRQTVSFETARFWLTVRGLFAYLPTALALHFALVFVGKSAWLKGKAVLGLLYFPVIVFGIIDAATDLMAGGPVREFWGYTYGEPTNEIPYWISTAWVLALVIIALVLISRFYRRTADARRRPQAKLIIAGFSLPLLAGFVDALLPTLGIRLPEMTAVSFAWLAAFFGYALYKYELFEVNPAEAADNIISTMTDTLLILDPQGRILMANRAAAKLLGYDESELQDRPAGAVFTDPNLLKTILSRTALTDWSIKGHETSYRTKSGALVPVLLTTSFVTDKRGVAAGVTVTAKDITERKKAEDAIRHAAYHDYLTGLPNRLLFKDRLDQALAGARRNKRMLGVLYIDVDHFKLINDRFGHEAGDLLLKTIGGRIGGALRAGDTAARLGGDEFGGVLIDISNLSGAAAAAEKILREVAKPMTLGGHIIDASVSIGVSIYPNDGQDADTLITNADGALFRAKEQRGSYRFFKAVA